MNINALQLKTKNMISRHHRHYATCLKAVYGMNGMNVQMSAMDRAAISVEGQFQMKSVRQAGGVNWPRRPL